MTQTIVALSLAALASIANAQDRLSGEWRGHWIRAGDSLPVRLDVARDSAGKYSAVFDSPRLRVLGIPFNEVRLEGCCTVTMRLQGDRAVSVFTGTIRDRVLSGELTEGESRGSFSYTRSERRHSDVVEREVSFESGGVTLAGTLMLPPGEGRHAAVVFTHGSGAEGRWASRFLATTIVERGVAAFIYDKRGVGRSGGDWRSAGLEELAGDAAAAVDFVAKQPGIDSTRVGLHGHSQGGTLAPMIAANSPRVAFVIASAGAGTPTDSTEIFSVLNFVLPRAATPADSADARAYVGELVGVAYHGRPRDRLDQMVAGFRARPWYFAPPAAGTSYWTFSRAFNAYQPLSLWRRVRVPVLLLYGADDQRVPASESAARIVGELLRASPSADVTVRIFPGADHTFRLRPGPSGWPVTAPDYVPALLDWLSRRR